MLNLQNAGALVPGINSGGIMELQTRRVLIVRKLYGPGKILHKVGTEVILPKLFALEMEAANKVQILPEQNEIPVEPIAKMKTEREEREVKDARKPR